MRLLYAQPKYKKCPVYVILSLCANNGNTQAHPCIHTTYIPGPIDNSEINE